MKQPSVPDSALRQNFLRQLQKLWPAIKGSLAQVRKPCIRPDCPACARGDKHPAFILSFTDKGRRRCMYVPAELAPQLQQALTNGKDDPEDLFQVDKVVAGDKTSPAETDTGCTLQWPA